MIELRDYQKELLARVESELLPDKARVMMQLPTGGGKTVIAAHLLKNWLVNGRKAVWLTHRKELVNQTRKMLSDAGIAAYPADGWATETPAPMINGGVIILMAQTVSRRIAGADVWRNYATNDLMIIDEAHHATADGYTRAMERWPGRVIGMTATPWRLSQKEGFDHLFDHLVCGPDVAELQGNDFLCNARVLIPSPEYRIQGGEIGSIGDYTEGGIERANIEHIMTASVLEFWRNHARDRQTIIYAVSVRHARNIMAIFGDAGIPTGIMLGDTPPQEREATIDRFSRDTLKVLVNVAVATEGFDLPDASCIVIARPTRSLTLYLQMAGRGLRPKPNDGDCLILDLAGNSLLHGLVEERRKWSLAPRGQDPEGEAPVAWCEYCESASPAASHNCQSCGVQFGEDCARCGKWRSWNRWVLRDQCEHAHDMVCDRCHRDAHIQNHLPVTAQMEALKDIDDEEIEESHDIIQAIAEEQIGLDDKDKGMPAYWSDLDSRIASLVKYLLEEEYRKAVDENSNRKIELREFIKTRDRELANETDLDKLFESYIIALPHNLKPKNNPQKYRMFNEWEGSLRKELTHKKNELANWVDQPIDENLIFERSKSRVLSILGREAKSANFLLSHNASTTLKAAQLSSSVDGVEWISLTKLDSARYSIVYLRFPSGKEIPVESWDRFGAGIANWLIEQGILSYDDCPVSIGKSKMYFIHDNANYFDTRRFHYIGLLDELFINTSISEMQMVNHTKLLLEQYEEDPSQYHIAVKS